MGMLQPCGSLDLGEKALGAEHGRQLRVEQLDGDFTTVAEVVGEVDGGHAAGTELALDPVAVRQGGSEPGDGVHEVLVP